MNVPSVISSELHFQLQAVHCSVTISFDVKMNDTSSKCRVSSAEGKDKSVSSHQEDWLRVIFMRWLSEEAKYKRVILRSVFFFWLTFMGLGERRPMSEWYNKDTCRNCTLEGCARGRQRMSIHVHWHIHTKSQKLRDVTHKYCSASENF